MNPKVFAKDNQCVGLSMLVTDAQANFHSDVYKMPRDDLSSTSNFIKSKEQAENNWNGWSSLAVTEE